MPTNRDQDSRPRTRAAAGAAAQSVARLQGSSAEYALDVLGKSQLAAFLILDGARITYASAAFLALIGRDPTAATRRSSLQDILGDADAERFLTRLAIAGDRHSDIYPLRRADGTEAYATFDAAAIETAAGPRTVVVAADVTSKMRSLTRLQQLAFEDALTGLPNRSLLRDRLEQSIAAARRSRGTFALLLIDLDRFKPINDVHGHAAGDLVLRETARRLRAATREVDTVARLGGDEFVVLLGGGDRRDEAMLVAARILQAVAAPLALQGLQLGVSIGIAIFPDDGADADQLLARADAAMYDAKHLGGSRCVFARPQGTEDAARGRLSWSPQYLVGDHGIDAEHEQLIARMNSLWEALQAGEDRDSLGRRLAQMMRLLEQHFAAEDAHMLAHPSPGSAAHRADHEYAIDTVRTLAAQTDEQSLGLGIRYLRDWLSSHLRSYDSELLHGCDG